MGLRVQNVSKTFSTPEGTRVQALDNVSIDVESNEFLILLGPSGCGKTTLLRIIAGLENADSGELHLNDQRIDTIPPNLRRVNTVFQSYALFPHLNVEQNIAFGLEVERQPKADIKRRVAEMLSLVELRDYGKRMPSQLSGGQRQRVALARALAKKPELLLLDEPLSALDLKLRRQMQTELKRIQQTTGIGFIFVTHDQGEALAMGDRIAVINEGQIEQLGTPREIYEEPTSRFVADFIGDTNLIPATLLSNSSILVAGQVTLDLTEIPGASKVVADGTREMHLVIHPERIKIDPAGLLKGTVTDTSYYGTEILIDVTVTDVKIRCRIDALDKVPQVGEIIPLQIEAAHARLVAS